MTKSQNGVVKLHTFNYFQLMKLPSLLIFSAFIILSCAKPALKAPAVRSTSIDSLNITITCINLSENFTGNDEVVILSYLYDNDSSTLSEPLFREKLKFFPKTGTKQFNCKLKKDISNQRMLFFLIEQDTELSIAAIDSAVRVSHRDIMREFNNRNYTGVEKYLGDEDVLGFRVIQKLKSTEPNVFSFSGIYKLDKYEYQVKLSSLTNWEQ